MKLVSPIMIATDGTESGGQGHYLHWCPACNAIHPLPVPRWNFNGNYVKPTFSPSFRQFANHRHKECHYFIRDGQIQYLSDSHHKRNDTIDMPPIPDEEVKDWT